MSWPAVAWAMAQRAPSSPCKFLLVTLADTASAGDWLAWPSVAYMSDTTQQDRKTVLCNLKRLEVASLIAAAGRTGKTGQVTVWRLPVVVHGKSPKNGTLADTETVPNFLANSTVFPLKESQKRDTEPVLNLLGTKGEGEQVAQPTPERPTAKGKKAKTSSPELTFAEWEATRREQRNGQLFDSEEAELVAREAEASGVRYDFMHLFVKVFAENHRGTEKRQKDWPACLRTYARNAWGPKLWFFNSESNAMELNTAGVMAAKRHGMDHLIGQQAGPDWNAVR